jgi:hypothetical protein
VTEDQPTGDSAPEPAPELIAVRLRRAPRHRAFIFTGVLIGLATAFFFAYVQAPTSSVVTLNGGVSVNRSDGTAGYAMLLLALGFSMVGAAAGALVSLTLERVRRR